MTSGGGIRRISRQILGRFSQPESIETISEKAFPPPSILRVFCALRPNLTSVQLLELSILKEIFNRTFHCKGRRNCLHFEAFISYGDSVSTVVTFSISIKLINEFINII